MMRDEMKVHLAETEDDLRKVHAVIEYLEHELALQNKLCEALKEEHMFLSKEIWRKIDNSKKGDDERND